MIFVTVGSSLPFDRLIHAADVWASATDHEVFAQIGNGQYEPRHMRFTRMLSPREFDERVRDANLIVAHAGMGAVISAMEAGRPIVILPRRAANREATTDHQIHTANWLKEKSGIFVAATEATLPSAIRTALDLTEGSPIRLQDSAPPEFIANIRCFLMPDNR